MVNNGQSRKRRRILPRFEFRRENHRRRRGLHFRFPSNTITPDPLVCTMSTIPRRKYYENEVQK